MNQKPVVLITFAGFLLLSFAASAQTRPEASRLKNPPRQYLAARPATVGEFMKTPEFRRLAPQLKQDFALLKPATRLEALNQALESGGDLAMIKIQSLMSQRQNAVQMTNQMMQSMKQVTDSIINNVR